MNFRALSLVALVVVACKSERVYDAGVHAFGPEHVSCSLTTACLPSCVVDSCHPTYCSGSSCLALPPGENFVRTDSIDAGATAAYCSAISALPSCGFNTCVYVYDPGPTSGAVMVYGYATADGAPPPPVGLPGCWSSTFATPVHHGRAFFCPTYLLEAGAACTN